MSDEKKSTGPQKRGRKKLSVSDKVLSLQNSKKKRKIHRKTIEVDVSLFNMLTNHKSAEYGAKCTWKRYFTQLLEFFPSSQRRAAYRIKKGAVQNSSEWVLSLLLELDQVASFNVQVFFFVLYVTLLLLLVVVLLLGG